MVTRAAREVKNDGAFSPGVSPDELERAWALTKLLSPQSTVRTAAIDASGDGAVLNVYPTKRPLDATPPGVPWAMNLFDAEGNARYLGFDFDAKKGNAAHDAGQMRLWLDELNIESLWCVSGPSGGIHLWVGLDEPTEGALAGEVARMAAQLLTTLDPVPMTNPRTGALRPPLSPHRDGGRSEPAGGLGVLERPRTSADDVRRLKGLLVDLGAELPQPWGADLRGVRLDANGEPHLLGRRRELSPRIAAILAAAPEQDASLTAARVAAACANARWRLEDVRELVANSPALEHVRSVRVSPTTRRPRSRAGQASALQGLWRSAVAFVALNPSKATVADEEFHQRLQATLAAIAAVQARAEASPGLWSGAGPGHAGRAVLDAVCLFMAQAVRLEVEVDVRRLSAETGYGRTRVSDALRWLIDEAGWVQRTEAATGASGQRVRLSAEFSTEDVYLNRTQVLARPRAAEPLPRNFWVSLLADRLHSVRHDVFSAPRSLGRAAGRLYQLLALDAPSTIESLYRRGATSPAQARRLLDRLVGAGLVERRAGGWVRAAADGRARVAETLGIAGYLAQRAVRYGYERAVWAWWSAEVQWMRKRSKGRKRRRDSTALVLFPVDKAAEYVRYPRGPDARGRHPLARQLVEAGALEAPASEMHELARPARAA